MARLGFLLSKFLRRITRLLSRLAHSLLTLSTNTKTAPSIVSSVCSAFIFMFCFIDRGRVLEEHTYSRAGFTLGLLGIMTARHDGFVVMEKAYYDFMFYLCV